MPKTASISHEQLGHVHLVGAEIVDEARGALHAGHRDAELGGDDTGELRLQCGLIHVPLPEPPGGRDDVWRVG